MLQIPRGIKNVPFSVCYKFPVPYTRNQKRTFFSMLQIPYLIHGIKTYLFSMLQIPYRSRTNSVLHTKFEKG